MSTEEGVLNIYTVDAFTGEPFTGNPAAVVLVPHDVDLSEEILQKIAAEFNLPNTAFVKQQTPSADFQHGNKFGIRWFTPTKEVPLCGHASMASARVLFIICGNKNDVIEFETKVSGSLFCRKVEDMVAIELPIGKATEQEMDGLEECLEILCCGHQPVDVKRHPNLPLLLVRLPDTLSLEEFESFQPDANRLEASTERFRMFTVTMKGDPDRGFTDKSGKPFDFVSRFFAPWYGVTEDNFTGTAHTLLSDYWSKELNKKEMYARQCSFRGGIAQVKVKDGDRVELTGKATIMIRGTLSMRIEKFRIISKM